jgi:hypothetical protein
MHVRHRLIRVATVKLPTPAMLPEPRAINPNWPCVALVPVPSAGFETFSNFAPALITTAFGDFTRKHFLLAHTSTSTAKTASALDKVSGLLVSF